MKKSGLIAGLSAFGLVVGVTTNALADSTITSSGPLTHIGISSDLNCSVNHVGDTSGEWFGNTACGTLVAVGGHLYGPADIPAGESATGVPSYIPFTPVNQTQSGAGTSASPFTIVTTVDLGNSGLRLAETDTYITGQESYRTDLVLTNTSAAQSAIVYRGGDCYLQNSDVGRGEIQNGVAPICKALPDSPSPNRIEGMYPITAGSHYVETFYDTMWADIGSMQQLPDTCDCNTAEDNSLALSWGVTVPQRGSQAISSLTLFSPLGAAPLTFGKTADASTAPAGGNDGYTVTVTNPGAVAESLTSIADRLPTGFHYRPGTSTGATTHDPAVSGQTLTWSGAFTIPAQSGGSPGRLVLHFGVTVASESGTYTNSVTGSANGVTVIPADNVAPIRVGPIRNPSTTRLTANPTTVDAGALVALTATVSPTPTSGTVNFTDNGAPIANCQNVAVVSGVANCSTSFYTAGGHPIVAKFSGNATLLPSTSNTVVVTVRGSCLGGYLGRALTVFPRQTVCLGPTAVVDGPVTVTVDAILYVHGSHIGAIYGQGGTPTILVCDAHVAGLVSIVKSIGPVTLGGTGGTSGCGGNTIGGSVILDSNTGAVSAVDNDIAGNLYVQFNTGSVYVHGNSVAGSSSVQPNQP